MRILKIGSTYQIILGASVGMQQRSATDASTSFVPWDVTGIDDTHYFSQHSAESNVENSDDASNLEGRHNIDFLLESKTSETDASAGCSARRQAENQAMKCICLLCNGIADRPITQYRSSSCSYVAF